MHTLFFLLFSALEQLDYRFFLQVFRKDLFSPKGPRQSELKLSSKNFKTLSLKTLKRFRSTAPSSNQKPNRETKREDDLQRDKKTENCNTGTYDVIRRNFKKSSSHEIIL